MDSTGGDLGHAAQEVDLNIEKQSVRSSSNERSSAPQAALGEKHELDQHSSGSSSEDVTKMEKLDSRIIKVGEVKDGDEAYAHLPLHEREIVKRQLDTPSVNVTYRTLYRYATTNDLLIVAISSICAIIGGAVMPLMTVSLPYGVSFWRLMANSMTGCLWPTRRFFPKFLQWSYTSLRSYFVNFTPYAIFHLLSHWGIHYDLYLYCWLHLYRRAHYPENPRAVSGGYRAPEYCIL